jgi:hypothetical protein
MKRLTIAAILSLAASVAHAQNYPTMPGYGYNYGGPSFPYSPPGAYAPQAFAPYSAPRPDVPQIRSYVPDPPPGPSGFPCTMPGCR